MRRPVNVSRFFRCSGLGEWREGLVLAYHGVSFGAEFCHHRLPLPDEVAEVASRCAADGLGFSLVTPLVREGSFDAVSTWLQGAARSVPGAEWVANDWGLLRWASERGLPLRPVAGRLLSRQRRGPRVGRMLLVAGVEETAALRGSVWDDPEAGGLLQQFGVTRVQLDWLLQGTRRPNLPPGVSLSLCGPWVPVTLSPSCPWTEDSQSCRQACTLEPGVRLVSQEDPEPLWSHGNATFLKVDPPPLETVVEDLGADRLVWSEEVPR